MMGEKETYMKEMDVGRVNSFVSHFVCVSVCGLEGFTVDVYLLLFWELDLPPSSEMKQQSNDSHTNTHL